ncbi:MAG: sulfite exporter TauE/SafE family protein [Candidatus Latescibacterota bacterium]|nr:MAG: sulfite exporter TauE/SafE family protein [Candidatus Latescibacterota bacterium]
MSEILIMLGGGLAAGVLGGFLGLGGGIILMPLLRFGVGMTPAQAAGTCVLAVFFTTLGGSYRHFRLGNVRFRPAVPVIVAGALAAIAASLTFHHLAARGYWLDLGIGIVFSLIAIRMLSEGVFDLIRRPPRVEKHDGIHGPLATKLGIGAVAGALPGLLGIGTGGILVPAFTFLLKTPIKVAIGVSLACFCLNAMISSSFKLAQGYIDLQAALPVCLATLVGANIGALLNGRFSQSTIKLVFGIAFSCIALKFIGHAWRGMM